MKKETIIAIIFGMLFGGVVAVLLIVKNKTDKLNSAKTLSPAVTVTPSVRNVTAGTILEIVSPEGGIITNKNSVTIKGKAPKGALLVVESPIKDLVMTVEKEDFAVPFPLALGENYIVVTSYQKGASVQTQVKELKIYYLTE